MTLPEIVLPKVDLPFDIPVLLHPFVVHFLVAIPVVVLLLELMNLMMKKKAVGGVSFFLLLLTLVASVGAYLTGLADGQDAAFTDAAKSALGEHKLLGTYLLLASALVLFLKLLAMTGSKVLKALYILGLIAFVVVMFKQGKEGGELVYKHGLNVEAVKTLDDKVFDLEEELEEALEAAKAKAQVLEETSRTPKVEPAKIEVPSPASVETPSTEVAPVVEEASEKTTISEPATLPVVGEKVEAADKAVVIPSPQQ